jgi:hypothetical protein
VSTYPKKKVETAFCKPEAEFYGHRMLSKYPARVQYVQRKFEWDNFSARSIPEFGRKVPVALRHIGSW